MYLNNAGGLLGMLAHPPREACPPTVHRSVCGRRFLGAQEAHVPHPTLHAWLSEVRVKATAFLQGTCLLARLWLLAGRIHRPEEMVPLCCP